MKKWMVILAAAAALSSTAWADAKSDVLAAMETWKTAMLKKDAATLDKLLHSDLTYSHSDGRTETKSDVLQSIPAGKLNVEAIDFKDSTVRVFGNTAVVKGGIDIRNNVDGKPVLLNLSVLQVWVKGSQGWQLVARQSTRLNK
jgi:ketosteroid isomerase-like protein